MRYISLNLNFNPTHANTFTSEILKNINSIHSKATSKIKNLQVYVL